MTPLLRILAGILITTAAASAQLRTGAAQVNINPAPGTPLAGYYSVRPGGEVLDDIHAKALVFEAGGTKAAVVIADLISMPRHVVVKTRELIAKETGIPGANVLIAATHTHTAPVIARDMARDDFDGSSSDLGRAYTEKLPALLAQSVADANTALAPVRLQAAKGRAENLAFNRRFWMKDGTVAWNPRKLDPNIVRPAGPVDPEVGLLTFDAPAPMEKWTPLATFVNYAMHPDTTGGVRISADYPGALARALAPG
jgi:neutral ceramidase